MIIKKNNSWVDDNNNMWLVSSNTKAEAQKKSASLINCFGCMECSELVNCRDCTDCHKCQYCENCVECYLCENCFKCIHLYWCTMCRGCKYSTYTKLCGGGDTLRGAVGFEYNPQRYSFVSYDNTELAPIAYFIKGHVQITYGSTSYTLDEFKRLKLDRMCSESYFIEQIELLEKLIQLTC